MPVLQAADIADLFNSTQDDLDRHDLTNLTTDIQKFEGYSRLLKQEVDFVRATGKKINLLTDDGDAAKHVGLFDTDDMNVVDGLVVGRVPLRHSTTNYAIDMKEEEMNSGSATQILELRSIRRAQGLMSLAKLVEKAIWIGATSSSDATTPFGMRYWITQSDTEGFNGGNHSGFSGGPGGISASTYPKWSNWTAQYTNVSKTDLIKKMRKAHLKIDFVSPVTISDFRGITGDQYRIYVDTDTILELEELLEAQNENLGSDLASMDGTAVFRRNPIVRVPYFDTSDFTTEHSGEENPVLFINWGAMRLIGLAGHNMKEMSRVAGNQHTVVETHIDLSWNVWCGDRRALARISK